MNKIFNSLKGKLIFWFMIIGLISTIMTSTIFYFNAKTSLEKEIYSKLDAVNSLKYNHLVSYFKESFMDLNILVRIPQISQWIEKIDNGIRMSGQSGSNYVDSAGYNEIIKEADSFLKTYKYIYGYHDLFLINTKGDIIYSIAREKDLGTNLFNGPYSNTNLARCVKDALRKDSVEIVDYENYAPSNAPACFIAKAVYGHDGRKAGVVVLQVSTKGIEKILKYNEGMGKTGESYLVGSDLLARSATSDDPNAILHKKIETQATKDVFTGKSGMGIIKNYLAEPVLSFWFLLETGNIKWALISDIDEHEAMGPINTLRNIIILITIIIMILIVFIGIYVAGTIANPLAIMTRIAKRISDDNDFTLSVNVRGEDEVGQLGEVLNNMVENLRVMVKKIQNAAVEVLSASTQIYSSTEEQAAGATEQSTAVQEVVTTIEELAASASNIAVSSEKVTSIAEDTLTGMQEMNEKISRASKKILALDEKSQSIGDVIKLIDNIAEQTNLLALNAAIEAARAGEAGKGFAVVAQEIRKLSERTSDSTDEIRHLINEIQGETNAAVLGVEESTRWSSKGLEMTREAARSAKEISLATHQQRSASDQVVIAVQNVDTVSKQFALTAKQSAASATQLNNLAAELKNTTVKFKVE